MSYTFYVSDWHKQPTIAVKEYIHDIIGRDILNVDDDELSFFPDAVRDDKGWFIMSTQHVDAFPELNIVNGHLTPILNAIGLSYKSEGVIRKSDIDATLALTLKAINVESIAEGHSIETEISGNFISYGIDTDRIRSKLTELAKLLHFAKINQKHVYWG